MSMTIQKLPLSKLSLQKYESLKSAGLLFVYYPEATGNCNKDLQAVLVKEDLITVPCIRTHDRLKYHSRRNVKKFFYDILDKEADYEITAETWN